MKKAVFIIIVLLLARPVIPVVNYIINYKYIVKELCENRLKPEMECNGKCHLKKELAKAAENEKPLSEKKAGVTEFEIVYFSTTNSYEISAVVFQDHKKNNIAYANLYKYITSGSFFHPPAII